MTLRLLAVGAAILGLAGCIPYWTEPYYEPSAPGGTLVKSIPRCPGPPRSLEFVTGEVTVHVSAIYRRGHLSASMIFAVPEGHVVSLLGRQLLIRSDDGPASIEGQIDPIIAVPRVSQPTIAVDDVMVGASRPVFRGSSKLAPQGFIAQATVDIPEPTSFTLTLPKFSIDGLLTALPEIRFTRRRHHYVMAPINC
jgi:hypothetical protein